MLILRRILLFLFTGAYLIVCPLIIFHALGLTFKPETQTLLKTGIIYLSTIPSEANVYINNKKYRETTPTILHNLPPGNHSIKISLKNHKPWKKILPVRKAKATSVENILLIPKQWNPQHITTSSIEDLISLGKQPILLLAKSPFLKDLYHYSVKTNLTDELFEDDSPLTESNLTPVFPATFPYREKKMIKYFSADDTPFILIQIKADKENKFFWLDLSQIPFGVKDISQMFSSSADPQQILWNKTTPGSLISVDNGAINHLDIKSMTVYPKIAVNAVSTALYRQHLYVLTSDYLIKQIDFEGNINKILLNDAKIGQSLFSRSKEIKMTVYADDLIVFLTEKESLISNHLPYTLVEKDVKGFIFDDDTRQLLFWTRSKIGILDFSSKKEEGIFEKGPILTWLGIKANHIQQAFFANQGAQVVYMDQNTVMITETVSFNQPVTDEIVSVKKGTLVKYSDKNGKLFYVDQETSHLSFIQMRPENTFFTSSESEKLPKKKKINNEI